MTSDALARPAAPAAARRTRLSRILENLRRRRREVTESLHQSKSMSPSTAISLAGLVFAMLVQTAVVSYYMGRHADREDVHDREISSLKLQLVGTPTLVLRMEQAEKSNYALVRELRYKEEQDSNREMRQNQVQIRRRGAHETETDKQEGVRGADGGPRLLLAGDLLPTR